MILAYAYDANSRLTNRWSVEKGNTAYGYDDVGNLLSVNYPVSTDISYQYDALNRMTNMVDAVGTTYWYHDHANRQTVEDGPWASDNVTNKWNTAGLRERLGIQQPTSFFNTAYTYDAAKRLDLVTSGAGTFTNYYHTGLNGVTAPSRLLEQMDLPNGAYIANTHDNLARLTETALRQSGGTITNKHAYVYNNAHQRTKQTWTDNGYVDYLYDDVGQLYSARTYNAAHAEITSQKFGYKYDPAFNLNERTNNAAVTTFVVNNLNELTSAPGTAFTYDDNGNLLQQGVSRIYTYDDENQAETVTWSSTWKSHYFYDGKMRKRKKLLYYWTGSTWSLNTEVRYLYDGMLPVQERSSANAPTVTYTRGNDLSGSLNGAGGIGGLLARSHGYSSGTGGWSTHNYYHADGNGNVTFLINSSQTIAASYKYNPFGGTIASSGSYATANTMRFSSKEIDSNAGGIYYYGYRWYDPLLQRWLNRDPLGEAGGINLYTFANNSSINRVDGFGLTSEEPGFVDGLIEWGKNVPGRLKDAANCVKQWCKRGFGAGTPKLPGARPLPGMINAGAGAVISAGDGASKTAPGLALIGGIEAACRKCKDCEGDPCNAGDREAEEECRKACEDCEKGKEKSHGHIGKF